MMQMTLIYTDFLNNGLWNKKKRRPKSTLFKKNQTIYINSTLNFYISVIVHTGDSSA